MEAISISKIRTKQCITIKRKIRIMAMKFTGSICLSDIPKSEMKAVYEKDANGNYIPLKDANGNYIVERDANGNPMYQRDANGQFVTDANGNPVLAYKFKYKVYVNISVHENKEPLYRDKVDEQGHKVKVLASDHFISCAPKKEERVDGANYICGNLKTWVEKPTVNVPTSQDVASAPMLNPSQAQDFAF